jgi:hypothetical protein
MPISAADVRTPEIQGWHNYREASSCYVSLDQSVFLVEKRWLQQAGEGH